MCKTCIYLSTNCLYNSGPFSGSTVKPTSTGAQQAWELLSDSGPRHLLVGVPVYTPTSPPAHCLIPVHTAHSACLAKQRTYGRFLRTGPGRPSTAFHLVLSLGPFTSLLSGNPSVLLSHTGQSTLGSKKDHAAVSDTQTQGRAGRTICFSPFSRVKHDPLTPQGAQNPSHPDNHFQMDLETSLPSVLDSGGAVWLSLTSWCGLPAPPSQGLQPPFPSPHRPASWLLRALGRQFKVAPKGPLSIPVSLEEMSVHRHV